MKEEVGYELTALTDKFKSKIKSLASYIRNFGKEAEEETTIEPKLVDTGFQKRIDYVKAQMQEIQDALTTSTDKSQLEPLDLAKLESQYEDLSYKLEDLNEKQEEFNASLEETDEKSSNMSSNLGSMFDRSIAKIKRFTFYLLGARSVFSMFMKYQSIYYQYNEEMRYQSELSQNAIALSLAPAFEFLGNVIAYASIAFAKFIELLTGVNILSKVSTKGIRDYNKSLKESQSLLSGLDEITNLTLPNGTGLASQYKALDEFKKKIEEVEKFFKENKWIQYLVDGLKEAWRVLEEVGHWIERNWYWLKYVLLGSGIMALTFKLGLDVAGLATSLGSSVVKDVAKGSGLLGFAGVMKYLATLGLISLGIAIVVTGAIKIKEMISDLKELKKQRDLLNETNKNTFQETLDFIEKELSEMSNINKDTDEWKKKLDNVKEGMKLLLNIIALGQDGYEDYIPTIEDIKKKIIEVTGEDYTAEIEVTLDTAKANEQSNKWYNQLVKYWGDALRTTINEIIPDMFNNNIVTKGVNSVVTDIVSNVKTGLNGLGIDTSKLKTDVKKTTSIVTTPVKSVTSGIGATLSNAWSGLKNALGFATGLDYVPYDDFPALLHKGEAVVPAKYNPEIHSMGNDYTNSLLETLIVKMDNYANRPINLDIDGQKFANATYGLYEETRSNQNYVEGVVR